METNIQTRLLACQQHCCSSSSRFTTLLPQQQTGAPLPPYSRVLLVGAELAQALPTPTSPQEPACRRCSSTMTHSH